MEIIEHRGHKIEFKRIDTGWRWTWEYEVPPGGYVLQTHDAFCYNDAFCEAVEQVNALLDKK